MQHDARCSLAPDTLSHAAVLVQIDATTDIAHKPLLRYDTLTLNDDMSDAAGLILGRGQGIEREGCS